MHVLIPVTLSLMDMNIQTHTFKNVKFYTLQMLFFNGSVFNKTAKIVYICTHYIFKTLVVKETLTLKKKTVFS